MKKKNVNPDEFLEFVHDIDISWLPKDKILREELTKMKEDFEKAEAEAQAAQNQQQDKIDLPDETAEKKD